MAEPHPRSGRTRKRSRPARALLLISAIIAIVCGGLFIARSAVAAPSGPAAPAATAAHGATAGTAAQAAAAAPAARAVTAAKTTLTTQPETAGGICNVPGIGDIGGLIGLCQAGSGVVGDLNNICTPGAPQPELATAGIDSMITIPGNQAGGKTLYDNYGIAGQYWAATGLKCSDMTSLIGNNVAGMVFDMAKSLDRVTITVYQSAAGSDILSWLSGSVDNLIKQLGNAIYFPFLAPVVIIGAIWLAWQGLVRKRATRTIEGTIWMVIACVAAIWLIGRPGDFTNVGTTVSNGVTSVLNTAFAKLPATAGSNCLPVGPADNQSVTQNYTFASGNGLVDENANELWTVLVCKPWLDGEFGTSQYAIGNQPKTVVDQYGRQLLWAQAVAVNEQPVTTPLVQVKMDTYNGIFQGLQQTNPAVASLFQGDQWTTRLEIGFTALFAAVAAGLLVLLIALTLIVLKLGFLLLLVAGPFFLIIGVHPGFGRVIALRWFEMLVGVLMKQVAVALTLSVLLYCYSLIMGTTDQVLPWALKIMMIALVTVAVFIYRKPFQHLFSSVGYGMLGNNERAEVSWRESAFGFRRVTATAGAVAVPRPGGASAATGTRWARSGTANPGGSSADGMAAAADAGGGAAADALSVVSTDSQVSARQWPDAGVGTGRTAPPLPLPPHAGGSSGGSGGTTRNSSTAGWAKAGTGGAGTGSRPAQPPVRRPPAGSAPPASPPSASTPAGSSWPQGASGPRSGQSPPSRNPSGAAGGTGKPPVTPFWARTRRRPQ
jgi:hypothetical protein